MEEKKLEVANKTLIIKNSFYNVLYRCLNIVFPFITSVYVARVLLAESIGRVAAAQNVVSYFTILAAMGIPTYGIKLVAQYKTKTKEMDKAFSELFIINFILTVLSSICYYLLVFTVPFFYGKRILYSVTGISLVLNIINVDWFYQGIQEYGYIAKRSFAVKCVSLLALVICVRDSSDYVIYALLNSCALVANYLFNIFKLRKYVKLFFQNLVFKEHLSHIFFLFIASIAAEVYVLADTTMLDVLCSSEIVGYYTMSMRIMRILRGLVVAVAAVFLPQLSNYFYNGEKKEFLILTNKGLHILITLSFPVALGIILVADDAILIFFGPEFASSILTTRILAVSVISVALSNFIGMQILVTIGKERVTTLSTICGALINVILNYFLIFKFQHVGAAIASVITEMCVTIIQIVLSRKYIKLRFYLKNVMMALLGMLIIVSLIHLLPISIMIRFLCECAIGAVTYFVIMNALKDQFVVSMRILFMSKLKRQK